MKPHTDGRAVKALTLKNEWISDSRWQGLIRPYEADQVLKLRGSIQVEHTFAKMGARKFWDLLQKEDYVPALGAVTGNQAVQQVKAGLKAIYCSGWQVAGDANSALQTYPDQSLYPVDSVPKLVRRINYALRRADQVASLKGENEIDWFAPIVADAEAGFGGVLNVFELMKEMIDAGAAAAHFEDQLSSSKKCGHLGGKVLVPTGEFIQKLVAARLASDVSGVPTILIARTDANSAKHITNDIDDYDKPFLTGKRTNEGFWGITGGLEMSIARALAYAPYADMLWFETSSPSLDEARKFSSAVHRRYPGKLLAYNCSPSFNWKRSLSSAEISRFQRDLAAMGYKFQFVTLAGFHALNHSMFSLARKYAQSGMAAYVDLQENEFLSQTEGYDAVKHQDFVGTGYFDEVAMTIAGDGICTLALAGSTEEAQFRA